ncbi:hypothetical protein Cni_G13982 [Canna indica]|uniref:Uncharacterized protein n=1 Tax=Canna indica TaxID=4628 RepID=A0AAQ3KD38_9LILI|nr:hypothetical protein Cni_G13982 [Canna indica]
MKELQEARKIDWKNLTAAVEDKMSKKEDRRTEDHSRHKQGNDRGPRIPHRRNASFERHTPFNTKKETIIGDIYHLKLIKYPTNVGKQKLPPNADMSKKCAYHDIYGHTTEECVMLGDQLEDLVHIGHLDKYLHHRKERENFIIKKVLVDQGSSTDILFYSTFEKIQLTEASFTPCKGDLVGFSGERVDVRRAI